MSSKQIASDEYSYYIENLLFNHDIELLSQFVKDMSFEKKEDYAYFTEEDFKGKTDLICASNVICHVPDLNNLITAVDHLLKKNGTFVFEVPALNCTVEVKLLNGHDEKRLSQITKAKNKNKLVETFVTDTLKSYIVSVNGDSSRATVNRFVDTLPARQSRYIRRAYRRIVPTVSIESEYSCSSCGHTQDLEVPLNADFFWPDR